jgi:hypothetical protein
MTILDDPDQITGCIQKITPSTDSEKYWQVVRQGSWSISDFQLFEASTQADTTYPVEMTGNKKANLNLDLSWGGGVGCHRKTV